MFICLSRGYPPARQKRICLIVNWLMILRAGVETKKRPKNRPLQGAQWDSFAIAQATSSITNPGSSPHRTQKKSRTDVRDFQGAQWDSFAIAQATSSITNPGSSPHRTQKKSRTDVRDFQGAQWDSNPRHSEPQSDALTN